MNIIIYVYADEKYSIFAIPYVYFALKNNPSAFVEVSLSNLDKFKEKNRAAIDILTEFFPGKFKFSQSTVENKYPGIIPNTIRFLGTPCCKAEYLYIGDIDLLIFDNLLDVHLALINQFSLTFSNIVRIDSIATGLPRLSGLHFCKFEDYYPLPDISDIDLKCTNDENVLYEIMRRRGLEAPLSFQTRPECGIHMSLSRDPAGRTTGAADGRYSSLNAHGWGGRHYYTKFTEALLCPYFQKLLPHMDLKFRMLLLSIEAIISKQIREMHRFAMAYLVDKRLLVVGDEFTRNSLAKDRTLALDTGDLNLAEFYGIESTVAWPFDINVWFRQAWLWLKRGEYTKCVEALWHIIELPGGVEFLSKSNFVNINSEKIGTIKSGEEFLSFFYEI